MNIGNPNEVFPVKTGATLAPEDSLQKIIEQSARIDIIHRNHRARAYSNKVARKQSIKSRIMTAITLIIFCLLIITIGKASAKDTMDTYIQYGVLCSTTNIALNSGHKIIPTDNVKIKDVNVGDNVTCTFNTNGELISVERR